MADRKLLTGSLGLAIIIAGLLLAFLPAGAPRQIPAFLLLWIWPAIAWAVWLPGALSERLVIGAGLTMLAAGYSTLLISMLPGGYSPQSAIFAAILLALIPLLLSLTKKSKNIRVPSSLRSWLPILLVLALAVLLRLSNLEYKELQGDEGIIMARAAAVISGDESEIFLHQKGPMEIMLPTFSWVVTGALNDFWLRIPFAWAGIIVVLGVYILTRRWFDHDVAIFSSLLFSVGGFGIAFSRIVQYQSLEMLWGILALVCADRYRKEARFNDLLLSVFFISGAILAHYDALLIVPAFIWIVLGRLKDGPRTKWNELVFAGAFGLLLLMVFYIPFILSPNFARTFGYLIGDRLGLGDENAVLGIGAVRGWQMSTFYNSTWYVLGLIILAAVALVFLAKKRSHFAAVLYLVVPIMFYGLIVEDPRTHIYTIYIPTSILAGYGALQIWAKIQKSDRKLLAAGTIMIAVIWLIVVTLYPVLLFVDTTPERQRTWDKNRPLPWLYLTTWDEPPSFGLFGFPHQAGWRVARELTGGQDDMPYISNEEEEITNWYMAQSWRTHCPDFVTYIEAANTQDTIEIPEIWQSDLNLKSMVSVNGIPSLEIYSRAPVDNVLTVEASDKSYWVTPQEQLSSLPENLMLLDVNLEGKVSIVGYELDTSRAWPGGQVIITIYWQALKPLDRNNQVFTHLYDGVILAQHDSAPECGINPTSRWEPGQIIPDSHNIDLPQDIPTGKIPLIVGMYDLVTGERLRVEQSEEDSVYLTDVTIVEH